MIDFLQIKRAGLIKAKAIELGFDACGISKAEYLEEEAPRLEKWLNLNYHGKMAYMANHFAKYAYGTDYHFVLKDKLKELMAYISEEIGEVNGRVFVDSAPVMDKVWAKKSGIGWVGKHTNLITREIGSFFFIGENDRAHFDAIEFTIFKQNVLSELFGNPRQTLRAARDNFTRGLIGIKNSGAEFGQNVADK